MSLIVSGGCVINIHYRFYIMELIRNYSTIIGASLLYICTMYVHYILHLSPPSAPSSSSQEEVPPPFEHGPAQGFFLLKFTFSCH